MRYILGYLLLHRHVTTYVVCSYVISWILPTNISSTTEKFGYSKSNVYFRKENLGDAGISVCASVFVCVRLCLCVCVCVCVCWQTDQPDELRKNSALAIWDEHQIIFGEDSSYKMFNLLLQSLSVLKHRNKQQVQKCYKFAFTHFPKTSYSFHCHW